MVLPWHAMKKAGSVIRNATKYECRIPLACEEKSKQRLYVRKRAPCWRGALLAKAAGFKKIYEDNQINHENDPLRVTPHNGKYEKSKNPKL